jgi:hypothetical protein
VELDDPDVESLELDDESLLEVDEVDDDAVLEPDLPLSVL